MIFVFFVFSYCWGDLLLEAARPCQQGHAVRYALYFHETRILQKYCSARNDVTLASFVQAYQPERSAGMQQSGRGKHDPRKNNLTRHVLRFGTKCVVTLPISINNLQCSFAREHRTELTTHAHMPQALLQAQLSSDAQDKRTQRCACCKGPFLGAVDHADLVTGDEGSPSLRALSVTVFL